MKEQVAEKSELEYPSESMKVEHNTTDSEVKVINLPEDYLQKAKESHKNKESAISKLKEKIFSMFKEKTIAEMTDRKALSEVIRNDLYDLSLQKDKVGINMSSGYRSLMVKYGINNEEGEKLVQEIESIKKQLNNLDYGDTRITKQEEFNKKRKEFSIMLNGVVEKRLLELDQKSL